MIKLKKINAEVFIPGSSIAELDRKDIRFLMEKSRKILRSRARINIHRDHDDLVHEMFIVHNKNAYIRPHKHLNKSESLHIIEGTAEIILFSDDGEIERIISMGKYESGNIFFFKLEKPVFHSLIVTSKYLVFKETGKGPFIKNDKMDAPWSPAEDNNLKVKSFMEKLSVEVKKYLHKKNK